MYTPHFFSKIQMLLGPNLAHLLSAQDQGVPCVTNRLLAAGCAARWADGDGTATPQVPGTVGFLDSSPHHHCWALISFSTPLLTRQIWA